MLEEPHQKGLKSVNMKMTMFVFIIELGFPVMAITVGYEAQLTPFPWSIESIPTSHHLSHFGIFAIVIYSLQVIY
jgi:hypothetical protein